MCIWPFFFVMRSCKYLRSSDREDNERIKIIRLKNIRAMLNEKTLDYRAKNLIAADMILVTFEYQKIIQWTKQCISSKKLVLCVQLYPGQIQYKESSNQYQETSLKKQKCMFTMTWENNRNGLIQCKSKYSGDCNWSGSTRIFQRLCWSTYIRSDQWELWLCFIYQMCMSLVRVLDTKFVL